MHRRFVVLMAVALPLAVAADVKVVEEIAAKVNNDIITSGELEHRRLEIQQELRRQGLTGADSASLSGAALHRVLFAPGFSTRTDVTETSGRGIGLDVVQTAVEDLGGSVEIETEPGAGTTFIITLPVTHMVLEPPPSRLKALRTAALV